MRIVPVALLVMLSLACGSTNYTVAPRPGIVPPTPAPVSAVSRHVVLVSIDGLRPDAISAFRAPTLTRLVREGSYTLAATTITPSSTLPSHTSMITGEPPERHGVLWNDAVNDRPGTLTIPTIFSAARENGYRTAAFFSKSKFSHLQVPGTLDYSQSPGGWFGRWSADATMKDVEKYLASNQPNLLFVHLTDPDAEGHSYGWMTPQYGRGVLRADAAVARLMKSADATFGAGQYTLIVTADHGGHGRSHGTDHASDVTIPWIAWGHGVAPGEITERSVRTMDTASTVLFVMGVETPREWMGIAIRSAFLTAAN